MDELFKKFKGLPEIEIPPGMHQKIMRQAMFVQFRAPMIFIAVLSVLSLLISGGHIWSKVAELDSLQITMITIAGLSMDYVSLIDLIETFRVFFPVGSAIVFVVNLILLGCISYLIYVFKKMLFKSLPHVEAVGRPSF